MGFFTKIYVGTDDGIVTDITDLDKKHYEAFLDGTEKIRKAYYIAIKKKEKPKKKWHFF